MRESKGHSYNGYYPGRRFPLTKNLRAIINKALTIPGESAFLFHEANQMEPISKTSYELYLRRTCKRLGLNKTNNHAFRMYINSKLKETHHFSSRQCALLLGHTAETNDKYYTDVDDRAYSEIEDNFDAMGLL